MPYLMTDLKDYASHVPSTLTHIRRAEDGAALCGDTWGSFAVAEPGAELSPLLPFEEACARCAAAHLGATGGDKRG